MAPSWRVLHQGAEPRVVQCPGLVLLVTLCSGGCEVITTYTSRDAEACAYLSALVTVELCAEVRRTGKVNTAIRRCVNRQLPGIVEHKRVYLIFKGLAKQPFPAGCLHHLRRMLEEMAGGQVVLEG